MNTRIKALSFIAAASLAAASYVCAADPTPAPAPQAGPPAGEHGPRPDGKKMRERRMQRLEEALQLTPAQKQQIIAIWDQAEAQGKSLKTDAEAARDAHRQQMMEIMKATHEQVRGVLTPEQQKTFDAMPPEGRRHGPRPDGGAKPGDVPPPPPPQ